MSLCLRSYKCSSFVPQIITFHISFILQQFEFTKTPLPTSKEDEIEFLKKLLKYNITLAQYESTLLRVKLSRKFTCTCNNIWGCILCFNTRTKKTHIYTGGIGTYMYMYMHLLLLHSKKVMFILTDPDKDIN